MGELFEGRNQQEEGKEGGGIWFKYFTFMYENRRMKLLKSFLKGR
jgi:hypothetical protein